MPNPPPASAPVLPFDVAVGPRSVLSGSVVKGPPPTPPTYGDVLAEDLVAPEYDPDRWFLPSELPAVTWLRSRGLDVRSVRCRTGQALKTPDAVAPDHHVTIEIKTAVGSPNSIIQRIRTARWQARHVMVDLRGTGTTREAAAAGLAAALDMYGMHLDEVVIIVTDNLAIGWVHG